MKKKVFCSDCEYLWQYGGDGEGAQHECLKEKNKRATAYDDYYSRGWDKKTPIEKNSSNDCKDFKQQEHKRTFWEEIKIIFKKNE